MKRVAICAALLVMLAGAQGASAAIFTVDATSDEPDADTNVAACATAGNKCTLRAAIQQSNASSGTTDTINFGIATGPQTIKLTSDLPAISDPVTINGYTQPGGSTPNPNAGFTGLNGVLNIVLDGDNHKTLVITGGDTTVQGLVIQDAKDNGITLQSAGNSIEGNYIGTDRAGTAAAPNRGAGIVIDVTDGGNTTLLFNQSRSLNDIGGPTVSAAQAATPNTIGGTAAAKRNLISGNGIPLELNFSIPSYGVWVKHGDGAVIAGNLIGTDKAGTGAISNALSAVRVGDFTASAPNTIVGGTAVNAGNVLSGNGISPGQAWGVQVGPAAGTGVKILGNRIGTDVTGTMSIGNNTDGIDLFNDQAVQVGAPDAGNLISGNVSMGLSISNPDNVVRANKIGTNALGTAAVPNGNNGIYQNGQTGTTIGGTNTNQRNIISGNGGAGIRLVQGASGNDVQGNFIGTNEAGTAAVPNGLSGIKLEGGSGNVIGGTRLNVIDGGGGNLISGNLDAGVVLGPGEDVYAEDNDVLGNLIGTDGTGGPLPNGSYGIHIQSGKNNGVGGSMPSDRNTIAYNGADAVFINNASPFSSGNTISLNQIFSNAGLGIDLDPDGVTANDAPPDSDPGNNGLQNFPLLHAAIVSSDTTISGTLLSAPNKQYTVDFYKVKPCDPSGNGEGDTPLASKQVTTDNVGYALFSETVSFAIPLDEFVTATATDPGGNTSEFSPCRQSGTSGDPQPRPEEPSTPPGPGETPPVIPPVIPPVKPPSCIDKRPPITTLRRPGVLGTGGNVHLSALSTLELSGKSRDRPPCKSGLRKVEVSLARVSGRTGVNCRFIRRPDRYLLTGRKNCRRPTLFRATGLRKWKFTFPLELKPGFYRAQARATDKAGNKETPKKGRNIVVFEIR